MGANTKYFYPQTRENVISSIRLLKFRYFSWDISCYCVFALGEIRQSAVHYFAFAFWGNVNTISSTIVTLIIVAKKLWYHIANMSTYRLYTCFFLFWSLNCCCFLAFSYVWPNCIFDLSSPAKRVGGYRNCTCLSVCPSVTILTTTEKSWNNLTQIFTIMSRYVKHNILGLSHT